MMVLDSHIETFSYPAGEIQRVQVVRLPDFEGLTFFHPHYAEDSFHRLCRLYRDFIIPRFSALFGTVILFRLPDGEAIPFSMENTSLGTLYDPLSAVTLVFRKNLAIRKGELTFSTPEVKTYFETLRNSGNLFVAKGKRRKVSLLPVGKEMGFLSDGSEASALRVNGSFFTMDFSDLGSPFDHVGIPVGLQMEQGSILNPPQFKREALLVMENGEVEIRPVELKELTVVLDGREYRHGENCTFHERPEKKRTPKGGVDLVIVENRLVALHRGGNTPIPSGGFVLKVEAFSTVPEDKTVSYRGLEGISFALQVGNSVMKNGVETTSFLSPFYHFWNPFSVSYPPSMYPLNYRKARAPRIVLGADEENKPMLLWFEGAGKFGYEKGKESCGASLSECTTIAKSLGMKNGVHLDGGGSAQILLKGKRSLLISDRRKEDFSEVERAVPLGLKVGKA